MFAHLCRVCAFHAWGAPPRTPGRAGRDCRSVYNGAGALALMLLLTIVRPGAAEEIETEHLFGFTIGGDIGAKGEKEVESATTTRTGKGSGSYFALAQQLEAKNTLTASFRIAAAAVFAYHDIGGVPDFDDRGSGGFQGVSVEAAFRLIERDRAPFGLSVFVEPRWNRIDDVTGERVESYGSTLTLAADKEVVAGKLFAAVNVLYDPEATRIAATDVWMRQSTLGVSAALALQVKPGIFLGGEVRALTFYDGLAFGGFAGRGLFAGPSLYAKLSEHWWMSLAWNVQIAGHVADRPSDLDLVNFERHQAKLRFGYHF